MKPLEGGEAESGPPIADTAADCLAMARDLDRAGRLTEAMAQFETAAAVAESAGEHALLAEALRRLAIVRHRRQELAEAQELCQQSYTIATNLGCRQLTAEALNTLAAFALERGAHDEARQHFYAALLACGEDLALRARVEQNLGILSTIQGSPASAIEHYNRGIEAFRTLGDEEGLATALHNLAMVSLDLSRLDTATQCFREAEELAHRLGHRRLQALCLLNHTELHILRDDLAAATSSVNQAIQLFDQLGDRSGKGSAYRFLGMIHRLTGRGALAQARLEDAIELAQASDSPLQEAEARHELALVHRDRGENREALQLLNAARRLFTRLEARQELGDIASKVAELEASFLAVVREWGMSIESADTYTYGHSERVANYAVAVARQLGLEEADQMAIRVGAYLHDVGKVKIPPEILRKEGPLTEAEFELMKQHPVMGVTLLSAVAFPWDIVPIIRSHHEKWDGSGYPDGLREHEIPLSAQVICVVDVFDALTTSRPYRPAMSVAAAIEEMEAHRSWWQPMVLEAFLGSVGSLARTTTPLPRPAPAPLKRLSRPGMPAMG